MVDGRLLTRDGFRNAVFRRDGGECVVCRHGAGEFVKAQDSHHLVERRLWGDGGYYLDNGASLCGDCHLLAESTELSCAEIREAAGIKRIVLPEHLYADQEYDKWANPILPNGQRMKGELFHDPSVQKILAPVLHLFTDRVKHPRTFHLPFSPGVTSDDKVMQSTEAFEGQEVVVTVKMDGEQTSMYRDGFHARSLDTPAHPSRSWLWGLHGKFAHDLPEGWRLCGENLYAVHSIRYRNLPTHFLVHSLWDEMNRCLSWDDTVDYARLFGLRPVPVLWRGTWDEAVVRGLPRMEFEGDSCEGFVVRVARAFSYREFPNVVGKFVRSNHVATHGHWMRQVVEVNGLASNSGA